MWANPVFVHSGDGDGNGNGYGDGYGDGDGDGNGNGYGDGYGYGNGYGNGDGNGNGNGCGYGYGNGYGNGDGYGNMKLDGGRLYKLTSPKLSTANDFVWPASGTASAAGPFNDSPDESCPRHVGDGLCAGLTVSALTSGGLKFSPPNRLLLVEVEPADVLGADDQKLRAKRVTVVREATADEWSEVAP